jgi:hypothetical protein
MTLRSRYRLYQFGNRLQVFFLGLLLGIVLSGGFFLLKLDDYVKDLALVKSFTEPEKDEDEKLTGNQSETPEQPEKKNTVKVTDVQEVVTDSTDNASVADSTSTPVDVREDNEIVVRKNELLGEKVVQLVNLDIAKAVDSIRSKEAGIREEPGKSLTIEFWQSPLNSKGYTMSRSRVILFGFAPDDQVSLYRVENSVLMKTSGGVFRLENTADFRQMERVTDEALLAKLP